MLSQFTAEAGHKSLADIDFTFPKDVYPVGRLDADSEGLLLLTNDKRVNSKLLEPSNKHVRKYLVQVEGEINEDALEKLSGGVKISEKGKEYLTMPSVVNKVEEPILPERNPPVRFRKNIPTSWIELSLHEGKNRQVRKMTAAVGFPTLRLVRLSIEGVKLDRIEDGYVVELNKSDFYKRLKLSV